MKDILEIIWELIKFYLMTLGAVFTIVAILYLVIGDPRYVYEHYDNVYGISNKCFQEKGMLFCEVGDTYLQVQSFEQVEK